MFEDFHITSIDGDPMNHQSITTTQTVRVKKKHNKTRTGCVTCKARRVKCDEKKPICERCSVLGKACFYRPVQRGSVSRSPENESLEWPSPEPSAVFALAPIELTPETAQLQQFCLHTSLPVFKNLGKPFETFWTSALPQLSSQEACVAHIMVALAARQKASFYVDQNSAERFTLIRTYNKHYHAALSLLIGPALKDRQETVLLCCLMFISMENVKDSVSNGFLHLKSGLQVLREWKAGRVTSSPANRNSSAELIIDTLEPMFARFEAAVSPSIYNNERGPELPLDWEMPELASKFTNLAAARGSLYEIAQWVFSQGGHHQMIFEKPHSPELTDTLNVCVRWRKLLNDYCAEHPFESHRYAPAVSALETNHSLLIVLIKCTTLPNELLWGGYSNLLEDMLRNCEGLAQEGPTDVPQRRIKMSLLPRMVPALFTIAILCRRRSSQRRAVEIMNQIHSENHKDQCFIARIAEAVIELCETLEQASVMQLSSLESRIRPIKAELVAGSPGKIILTYIRPFVRPLVDDDPTLGPIIIGPVEEIHEIIWQSEDAPPARVVWLWPVIEFLRLAGSSGLVGPNTGHCLCKTYGALFALMRSVDYFVEEEV